jgi:hypothetical protein
MLNIRVQKTQTHEKLIFAQFFIIKLWDRKFVIDIVIRKPYHEKLIVMPRSDGQDPSIAPKKNDVPLENV